LLIKIKLQASRNKNLNTKRKPRIYLASGILIVNSLTEHDKFCKYEEFATTKSLSATKNLVVLAEEMHLHHATLDIQLL
jgi:hypothetical protein